MKRFVVHSPIFVFMALFFARCANSENERPEALQAFRKRGVEARNKAETLFANGQADSAFANFLKAKESFLKANDSVSAAHALLRSCDVLYAHNDYTELQATAVEALSYLNQHRDTIYLPSAYTFIGLSFAMSGDRESAETNFLKAKRFARSDLENASSDNNIAHANLMAKNFDKAFLVLSAANPKYNLADSESLTSKMLDNYGFAAFKTGRKIEGNPMNTAFEIRKRNKDTNGLITSYLHLAEAQIDSDPRGALQKAFEAEKLATENKSAADRLEVLRFLVENSDAESSKRYATAFVKLNDSLQFAERKTQKTFALIKYNFRKANRDRLEAELKTAQEQKSRLAWTIIALFAILTGSFLVSFMLSRQKKIKRKTEYDTEVRISHRLHDDLANDVHRTIVFTETTDLSNKENKETLLSRLEAIYTGTRSISHDNSEIPEHVDFAEYVKNLLTDYNSDERKVIAQGIASVNWDKLERLKKAEISRIIKELLTNMRKHSDCSHAFFNFSQQGKKIWITYADNGKGTDADTQKRKNGLRIMENRISSMDGTATFDSEPGKGFRAQIEISN